MGLVIGFGTTPASAANVANYTFHTPADVLPNPCYPADVVNLNGNIHIVITSTVDSSGGVHTTQGMNSHLTGHSITTGTNYGNTENNERSWYSAADALPAVHSETYDYLLVSRSNTPNYVLHMTMHTTVTSNGRPTAVVDNWRVDCQGSETS